MNGQIASHNPEELKRSRQASERAGERKSGRVEESELAALFGYPRNCLRFPDSFPPRERCGKCQKMS